MKIIITGANGQLGKALISMAPKQINNQNIELIRITRNELDLENIEGCKSLIFEQRPDWLINAGAYTAVDKAESEKNKVLKINALAPKAFAQSLKELGGEMIQISTDYVFNGNQNHPYKTNHKRDPINTYGKSKAIGEQAIEDYLFDSNQGTILRTSWLIGPYGSNFALTILNLLRTQKQLNIISDQIGSPTSIFSLSKACWRLIEVKKESKDISSILHFSDAGVASWYDLAFAIKEISQGLKLISNSALINPITTEEYSTPAKRPKFSLLDCNQTITSLNLKPINWRVALKDILNQISLI